MTIAAITIWEGTPKGLHMLEEGSRQSAPVHEGMGAKNPRLWRPTAGGEINQAIYELHFDSMEDYGRFNDIMMKSEWWAGTQKWMADNYDEVRTVGTSVLYDAI